MLGERNHEIQTFSPECPQESLADGVPLRALRRYLQDPQPQVSDMLIELLGKDRIPVVDEEPIGVVWRNRVPWLLKGPERCGVRGHIDMQQSAAGMVNDDEHIKAAERGGDDDTEVAGDHRVGMVAHKRPPALRRHASAWTPVHTCGHVLADRPR